MVMFAVAYLSTLAMLTLNRQCGTHQEKIEQHLKIGEM